MDELTQGAAIGGQRELGRILEPRGKHTIVEVMDQPGAGNANHVYQINSVGDNPLWLLSTVKFQKGPIKENGINGVMNEDLLMIVRDRLEGFQSGDYACEENAEALNNVKDALAALQSRTKKREDRGVEGTSTV